MVTLFRKLRKETTPEVENKTVGGIIRKTGANYCTECIYIGYKSAMTINEANGLIGKEIISVTAEEHRIVLTFKGNTQLIIEGITINEEKQIDSLDVKVIDNIINV